MEIYLPFLDSKNKINKLLIEPDVEISQPLHLKLYYDYFRSIIPIPIRQRLQREKWKRISHKDMFIEDIMVKQIFEDNDLILSVKNFYPDKCEWAGVLTHDVETLKGLKRVPKIMDIEEKYGFRSSWNIVPHLYPIDKGILREIRQRNHEIGIHGYNHDGKLYKNFKEFSKRALKINEAIKQYQAYGFRSPMVHRNLEWLQAIDIEYDSSCFDYDVYQPFPGGVNSIWPFLAGNFVELPYTLPQDHTIFVILQENSSKIWKQKTKWLIKHHGMVLMLTHPDYLDSSKRLDIYEEYLEFLSAQEKGWFVLPHELAAWTKSYIEKKRKVKL